MPLRRPPLRSVSPAAAFAIPDINSQYRALLEAAAYNPVAAPESGPTSATGPTFTLLTAVRGHARWQIWSMRRTIERQHYGGWETRVGVVPDQDVGEPEILIDWAAESPERVTLVGVAAGSPSPDALQAALGAATGDYVIVLDPGDELAPDALSELAKAVTEHPDADVIYSDEDRVGADGRRSDPQFKPAWSPELLRSMHYTGRVAAIRRSLALDVGGFRAEFDGAHEYDLILRLSLITSNVYHIPRVLCTRPSVTVIADADTRALADDLRRRGLEATVEEIAVGRYRQRPIVRGSPRVSIVIPSARASLLRRAVAHVLERTRYPDFEILVIDNSVDDNSILLFCQSQDPDRVRYLHAPLKPFNYASLVNLGVRATETPYVLLLNDDIEVLAGDWLTAMMEYAQDPEIGAVGAKLFYPDGRVQHAGIVLGTGIGPSRVAGHAHKYYPGDHPGYAGYLSVARNYSAVTGACLLTRRQVFDAVSGFDEVHLPVTFNDVDFCLRVQQAGYRIVLTPFATLTHYESATRVAAPDPSEVAYMLSTWAHLLESDPYYNPNQALDRPDHADFGLRRHAERP